MSEDATPTDGSAATLRSLTDPATLLDRQDVDTGEQSRVVDEEHFDRHDPIAGWVVVGLTNADGEVALVDHDGGHGWSLPHGPVQPGEDWAAAARHWLAVQTGIDAELADAVRVTRIEDRLEATDTSATAARTTTIHDVVLAARPASDDPTLDPDPDGPDVDWFAAVPAGAPDGDVTEDIRRFLD